MSENKTSNHPYLPLIVAISVCLGILIGFSVSKYQFATDDVQVASKKFRNILQLIDKEYADSVDINKLFEKGIAKTLGELDPHSSYIPLRDLITKTKLDSEISGIGVRYSYIRDTLFVTEVIKNGPAHKSGIMAGDRILAVNDVGLIAIEDQTVFANLIRGDKGSTAKVSLYRKVTNKEINITIVRDIVPVDAVDLAYMIDLNTGYIKLTRFSENSGNELHNQLVTLKKQGLKQLILDLRDNGGGYYEAAVQICDEFLPQGKDIVYTQSRGIVRDKKKSVFVGEFEYQKLIVLINENSASASEIVSACLQDNDRAVIIGRRSFGKGLVQSPFALFDGSEVRVTTARYFSPSGRCLQKPYLAYADTKSRLKTGELFDEEKAFKNDSLKYHTANQRTVYGGGGVYPDVFIPKDTSLNNTFIAKMLEQQLFLEFGVFYFSIRPELKKDGLDEYTKAFKVSDKMLKEYLVFCKNHKFKIPPIEVTRLSFLLKRELKIYLAEVIWGTNGMYRLVNINDIYITKAIRTFKKSKDILNPSANKKN